MKKLTRILSFLLALVICAGGTFTARADEFSNVEKYGYHTETLWDRYLSGKKGNNRLLLREKNKGEYQFYCYEEYLKHEKNDTWLLDFFIPKIGISRELSDLEAVGKVFSFFQQNWTYDYNEKDNNKPETDNLLAQRGVCAAYSSWFTQFEGYAGVNVCGVDTYKYGHGYNYVCIGDTFYLVDATWGWEHFLTGITNDYPDETHKPKNVDAIGWNGKYYSSFDDWKNAAIAAGFKVSTTPYSALPTIKANKLSAPKVTATKTAEGYILDWAPVNGATFYAVYSAELSSTSDYYIRKDNKKTHITNEKVYYADPNNSSNFTIYDSFFNSVNIGDKDKGESEHYRYYVKPSDTDMIYYVVAFDANGNSSFPSDLLTNNTFSNSRYAYQEPKANYINKTSYINYFFDRGNTLMDVTDDVWGYIYGNQQELTPKSSALILNAFTPSANTSCNYKIIRAITIPTATEKGCILQECQNCLQRRIIYQYADAEQQANCKHAQTIPATTEATCTKEGKKSTVCADCFKELSTETIPKKAHSYKAYTTPATLKVNGETGQECTVCGAKNNTTVIPKVKTVKLSKTAFVYNGKAQKPSVTVKDEKGKVLKLGTDYTVSYPSGCKKVGSYVVTVKLRGKYSGKKTLTFKITPKATALKTVSGKKQSLLVKWKKQTKQVTGYQLQVATNKAFTKNKKTVNIKGAKKASATVNKLKAKKKYYVRIRTYKTVGGKKVYSKWSKVKTAKTK